MDSVEHAKELLSILHNAIYDRCGTSIPAQALFTRAEIEIVSQWLDELTIQLKSNQGSV